MPYVKKADRPAAPQIDERLVLSMLPGKIITKRLLEKELATIREIVQGGRREYMALMPGLEIEINKADEGLRLMSEMIFGSQFSTQPNHQPNHQPTRLLKSGRRGRPPKTDAADGDRAIDVSTIIGHRVIQGKVTQVARILAHIVEHNGIVLKDFLARWQPEYPRMKQGNISQYVAFLRRAYKVKFRTIGGGYVLQSKLVGNVMEDSAGDAAGDAGTSSPQPPEPGVPHPAHSTPKFTGSQNELLLQEIAAGGGRTNIFELHKKYNLKRNAFNAVMSSLRKLGYDFMNNGGGNYTMIKSPKHEVHGAQHKKEQQ